MTNWLYKSIGRTKTRWLLTISWSALAFFMFFAGAYKWLFGKLLTWEYSGLYAVPAKGLAILFVIYAVSSWNT